MRRREFIKVFGVAAAGWPLAARAQQPERMRRIGVLMATSGDEEAQSRVTGFRDALTRLGWVERTNLQVEVRWSNGDADAIKTFAKELVHLRLEAIISQSTPVTAALVRETQTIPVVFLNVADPVSSGFVASLSRPGGNVTGFTTDNSALGGKWVELLKEIAPQTARVGLLFNPTTAVPLKTYMASIQAAASSLSLPVIETPVRSKEEIEGAIAAMASEPRGGLIVMPDPFNGTHQQQIVMLAARHSVPAMYFTPTKYPELGGLIAYGSNFAEQFPQAAEYVDRILKGAKPSDLPVQAPTKFDLVINLKTAKALGLVVSPNLVARATAVIE